MLPRSIARLTTIAEDRGLTERGKWNGMMGMEISAESNLIETHKQKIRALLLACRAYANEEEGMFPQSFDGIYPEWMDLEDFLFACDLEGNRVKMILYPGLTLNTRSNIPLIRCPVIIKGIEIVGFVDGRVEEVPAT